MHALGRCVDPMEKRLPARALSWNPNGVALLRNVFMGASEGLPVLRFWLCQPAHRRNPDPRYAAFGGAEDKSGFLQPEIWGESGPAPWGLSVFFKSVGALGLPLAEEERMGPEIPE